MYSFLFLDQKFLKVPRGIILQYSHGMSKLITSAHLPEKCVCIITNSDSSSAEALLWIKLRHLSGPQTY